MDMPIKMLLETFSKNHANSLRTRSLKRIQIQCNLRRNFGVSRENRRLTGFITGTEMNKINVIAFKTYNLSSQ